MREKTRNIVIKWLTFYPNWLFSSSQRPIIFSAAVCGDMNTVRYLQSCNWRLWCGYDQTILNIAAVVAIGRGGRLDDRMMKTRRLNYSNSILALIVRVIFPVWRFCSISISYQDGEAGFDVINTDAGLTLGQILGQILHSQRPWRPLWFQGGSEVINRPTWTVLWWVYWSTWM